MNPLKRLVNRIREINKTYATPRIRLSRRTSLALLALRVYLIVLVILLAYRFLTIL